MTLWLPVWLPQMDKLFNYNDFPPEQVDNNAENYQEASDVVDVIDESEEGDEEDWLPALHAQDDIDALSGIKDEYPRLYQEGKDLVIEFPEPYVPQHSPFLHGVTEDYVPPAII